jgi:hypothetical protein
VQASLPEGADAEKSDVEIYDKRVMDSGLRATTASLVVDLGQA